MRPALIVDLDGTLCNDTHRKHLYHTKPVNWNKVNQMMEFDTVNEWCLEIVKNFSYAGYQIIFLTGRMGTTEVEATTKNWLTRNIGSGVNYKLIMRPDGDHRPDTTVKQEIFINQIKPLYDVKFCIDDRESVTQMWRNIGLTCLLCDTTL